MQPYPRGEESSTQMPKTFDQLLSMVILGQFSESFPAQEMKKFGEKDKSVKLQKPAQQMRNGFAFSPEA